MSGDEISMEMILASIRRIIKEDGSSVPSAKANDVQPALLNSVTAQRSPLIALPPYLSGDDVKKSWENKNWAHRLWMARCFKMETVRIVTDIMSRSLSDDGYRMSSDDAIIGFDKMESSIRVTDDRSLDALILKDLGEPGPKVDILSDIKQSVTVDMGVAVITFKFVLTPSSSILSCKTSIKGGDFVVRERRFENIEELGNYVNDNIIPRLRAEFVVPPTEPHAVAEISVKAPQRQATEPHVAMASSVEAPVAVVKPVVDITHEPGSAVEQFIATHLKDISKASEYWISGTWTDRIAMVRRCEADAAAAIREIAIKYNDVTATKPDIGISTFVVHSDGKIASLSPNAFDDVRFVTEIGNAEAGSFYCTKVTVQLSQDVSITVDFKIFHKWNPHIELETRICGTDLQVTSRKFADFPSLQEYFDFVMPKLIEAARTECDATDVSDSEDNPFERMSEAISALADILGVDLEDDESSEVTSACECTDSKQVTTSAVEPTPHGTKVLTSTLGKSDGNAGRGLKNTYGALLKPLPLLGSNDHEAVTRALDEVYPWCGDVTREIAAMLGLTKVLGVQGFRIQPLLLVGAAGVGKTSYAVEMCKAAGVQYDMFPGGTDATALAGSTRVWSDSQPCHPIVAAVRTKSANPVIIVDEIDKAPTDDRHGSLVSVLLSFLEKSSSSCYYDRHLLTTVDLSRVNWVLTANDLSGLSDVFLSRCKVVQFPAPTVEHLDRLIVSARRTIASRFDVAEDVLPALRPQDEAIIRADFATTQSMRRLVMGIEQALGCGAIDAEFKMAA